MTVFSKADHAKVLEEPDYDVIRGPADAGLLISRLKVLAEEPALGVDTETTGLCHINDRVRLIQVGSGTSAVLVDLDGWRKDGKRAVPWERPGLRELKVLLESAKPKVLQNFSFDYCMLRGEGVRLGGQVFDTMVAAKLINNGTGVKNDLGSIASRVLKVVMEKELQKADWGGVITPEMELYAARDAIVLPRLADELAVLLKQSEVMPKRTLMDLMRLEMSCAEPIALMQWHGFQFFDAGARELMAELEQEADAKLQPFLELLDSELRARGHEGLPREADGSFNTRAKTSGSIRLGTKVYAGYNPRSGKQTAPLFEAAGILLPIGSNGKPSLDQDLLAFLRPDVPLIDMYLTWKEVMTEISQLSSLLEHQQADGRIHGSYRQMGTDTGRLSAAKPNLQQINRDAKFRRLFVAPPGYKLIVADFSQIELRVAAELSGEERMRSAYRAGRDLHTETACLITGKTADQITKTERTSAKIVNFGLLFGAGAATLRKQAMSQYGVLLTHKEAKHLVQAFREAYPTLKEWQDTEGNKTTKAVFTLIGRRRILIGFDDKFTTRINTQVQGTAGDIAKTAISFLWKKLRHTPEDEAKLICICHDELVMEVREDLVEQWTPELSGAMERAGASICTHVPIVAEASSGDSWAEAK